MSKTYIKLRYRGKLKHPNKVEQLIAETEDICQSNGWTYKIWDEDWSQPQTLTMGLADQAMKFEGHAPLKGISFSSKDSEGIWLTFMPDGILQSLFTLMNPTFFGNDEAFPWQRVKTGYDGATTHIALCKLFHYLADKYFEVFEVFDESNYWEEGDDAKFTEWINNLTRDNAILNDELANIMEDESLSKDQKRERSYRLLKEHGEKYRKKE